MKSIIFIFLLFFSSLFAPISTAQVNDPVKWEHSVEAVGSNTYKILFVASIESGWHMYGQNIPDGGPIPTMFYFDEAEGVTFTDVPVPSHKPEVKYDETFGMNLELFDGKITFVQSVEAKAGKFIKGYVEFMACNDATCLPPSEYEFSIELPTGGKKENTTIVAVDKPSTTTNVKSLPTATQSVDINENAIAPPVTETEAIDQADETVTGTAAKTFVQGDNNSAANETANKSLLTLFFIAFLAGFGALLTPCVYPMIPMTVSFFMRGGQSKSKGVFNGVVYGLSIVIIYTFVGLLVGLFKVDLVRLLSSHWLPNVIFFVLFMVLAISFFGVFEIVLPSSLANKVDAKAEKGGVVGPFFMALATAIISFSCTGIIVGSVLGAGLQGDIVTPVVGMFGFSLSFALPFTLLAIFPSMMNKLPKSGGWLNSVKVFFAFIMVSFSMVFLVNIDFAWLSRELVLSIQVVLFALLGLYFLGKIKFSHDSELKHISVTRLMFIIASFTMSLYLFLGLLGQPLGALEPFLPAAKATTSLIGSDAHKAPGAISFPQAICDESPKYSESLHMPFGLKAYYDLEQGLACAKELGKPVFLDFVGHSCKNCKKMYADVWSDSRVQEILARDYVIVALYVDDRTKLSENEYYTSSSDGKVKTTLGKKNAAFQVDAFGSNALPMYVITNADQQILTSQQSYTYSTDIDAFIAYLEEGAKNAQ